MNPKNLLQTTIAKKSSYGTLSLEQHGLDTQEVIKLLYDQILSQSQKEIIEKELDDNTLPCICALARLHDIGKLSFGFKQKIEGNHKNSFDHALASKNILDDSDLVPGWFSNICGSHHGKAQDKNGQANDLLNMDRDSAFIEKEYQEWMTCIQSVLNDCNAEELPAEIDVKAQILLSGLLVLADWIASDEAAFPLDEPKTDDEREIRYRMGLKDLNRTSPWTPSVPVRSNKDFHDVFGLGTPNSLQKACINLTKDLSNPGLFIIESEMRSGKTEAALTIASEIAEKSGTSGIFFGLPTCASANVLFPRLETFASKESSELHSVILAHGKADGNEEWERVQRGSVENLSEDTYLLRSKLKLLNNFVFGTVDTLLRSALPEKHWMLRILGTTSKIVIIDEVHAYGAWTDAVLEKTLDWLGAFQVPVILLSATLPKEKRENLVSAYLRGRTGRDRYRYKDGDEFSYPRITYTDGADVQSDFPEIDMSGKVYEIRKVGGLTDDLIKMMIHSEGCVGIIANTVESAQQYYDMIHEWYPEQEIILLHSKFTKADRSRIEKKILDRIGKNSQYQERKGLIIISTQVLEQSVDVDFDILFTELASIDSLLQRLGREQRFSFNDKFRPDYYKKPVAYILNSDHEYEPERREIIYSPWILFKSRENLPETLRIPQDIPDLIKKVYESSDSEDEKYLNYQLAQKKDRQQSDTRTLKSVNLLDDSIEGINSRYCFNNIEAQKLVRNADERIDAILLIKGEDGIRTINGDRDFTEQNLLDQKCPVSIYEDLIGVEDLMILPESFRRKYRYDKVLLIPKKEYSKEKGLIRCRKKNWS